MSDIKLAWEAASESFATLGRRLNEHYYTAKAAGRPADLSQIEEALETLADALERAVGAVGDSLHDTQAHADAEKAVICLWDALEVTFGGVGQELSDALQPRVDIAVG